MELRRGVPLPLEEFLSLFVSLGPVEARLGEPLPLARLFFLGILLCYSSKNLTDLAKSRVLSDTIRTMSHVRDLSAFDFIVLLIFLLGVGALSMRSYAPSAPSTPGASWPDAPPPQPKQLPAVVEAEPEPELEEATVEEESWD